MSRAICKLRGVDPEYARIRNLRRAIADRIEADLALLDALAGDPDQEADFHTDEIGPDGHVWWRGRSTDDEPSLCGIGGHEPGGMSNVLPQMGGGCGGNAFDLEGEDEHGGDIQDEPHDEDTDLEPDDSGIADQEGVDEQFAATRFVYTGAV